MTTVLLIIIVIVLILIAEFMAKNQPKKEKTNGEKRMEFFDKLYKNDKKE